MFPSFPCKRVHVKTVAGIQNFSFRHSRANGNPGFPFFIRGVSPPRDEALLFRQKGRKPFSPVRGPFGEPSPRHHIIWLRNSLRSDSPRRLSGFGCASRPRKRRLNKSWVDAVNNLVGCLGVVYQFPFRHSHGCKRESSRLGLQRIAAEKFRKEKKIKNWIPDKGCRE